MRPVRHWISAVLLGVVLTGCAQSEPSRFYGLASLPVHTEEPNLAEVSVGIVPVILPEYLNRPQIVTRSSPTTLEIAELERWVEPLDSMATRIMVQNLSDWTGSDAILVLPQRRESRYDWFLELEFLRFDAGTDGMVLDARWSLFEGRNETLAASKRSVIELSVDMAGADRFDAIARAMSVGMALLGEEILQAMGGG